MTQFLRRRAPGPLLLLLLYAGALLPAGATAQVIHGTVRDDGTRAPVAAAEVLVRDSLGATVATATTGADGSFRVETPGAGRYALTARHLAYAAVTSPAVAVARGEVVAVELRLRAEAVALEPLTVVTRRYPDEPRLREFYQRAERNQATGRGTVLLREDVEALGPIRLSQVVDRAPRISAGCPVFYYLDGMALQSLRELESLVPIEDIEGIEIYSEPTQVPARFQRQQGGCYNVFLAWRRPYGVDGRSRSWTRFAAAAAVTAAFIVLIR